MNIRRLFNRNRLSVIIGILIVLFVIGVIQLLNSYYKNKDNNSTKNITNTTKYEKESESIITGEKVSNNKGETFGDIIDSFLSDCVNKRYEDAYKMLSTNCKSIYYNSLEDFVEKYCKEKFKTPKKYNFQSWVTGTKEIYIIKLYEDMLSSGKATNSYIQDYYTIVKENGEYKLNINNFIGLKKIDKKEENDNFTLEVKYAEIYKDYYILNFKLSNKTKNNIVLDSRKKTTTAYIEAENGTKFKSLIYELIPSDLIVEPEEEKEIKIKYNIIYRDDLDLYKVVFEDIEVNNETIKVGIEI